LKPYPQGCSRETATEWLPCPPKLPHQLFCLVTVFGLEEKKRQELRKMMLA